jgi:hypothetical protein
LEKRFWSSWDFMVAVSFGVTLYFFGQISVAKTPIQIQLFDWIQINNFNVDFGFLLINFQFMVAL